MVIFQSYSCYQILILDLHIPAAFHIVLVAE